MKMDEIMTTPNGQKEVLSLKGEGGYGGTLFLSLLKSLTLDVQPM